MANVSWWIVSRALRVGMLGLSLGAIAGLSSLVAGPPAEVAGYAGILNWALIVLAPVLTWVVVRNDVVGSEAAAYATRRFTYARLLLIGVLGALLANALYFTLALNVPIALKGFEPISWRNALDTQIGGLQYVLALAVSAVCAPGIAFWAQRKAAAKA